MPGSKTGIRSFIPHSFTAAIAAGWPDGVGRPAAASQSGDTPQVNVHSDHAFVLYVHCARMPIEYPLETQLRRRCQMSCSQHLHNWTR